MRSSASRTARCWAWDTSRSSSASSIGRRASFRRAVETLVVPFTNSPAMPITAAIGRRPAIVLASSIAMWQLATTASMSLTVPDCMCARPCRWRPVPRTTPPSRPSSSRSTLRTSALAYSVPMSSDAIAGGAPRPRPALRTRSVTRLQRCPTAVTIPRSARLDPLQRLERQATSLAQRLVEAGSLRAARLGQVRASASPAPDDRCRLAHDGPAVEALRGEILRRCHEERRPAVAATAEDGDEPPRHPAQVIGQRAQRVRIGLREGLHDHLRAARVLGAVQRRCGIELRCRRLRRLRRLLGVAKPAEQRLRPLRDLLLLLAQELGGRAEGVEPVGDQLGGPF